MADQARVDEVIDHRCAIKFVNGNRQCSNPADYVIEMTEGRVLEICRKCYGRFKIMNTLGRREIKEYYG